MKTIIKLNNNNIRAMIQHLENIKKNEFLNYIQINMYS